MTLGEELEKINHKILLIKSAVASLLSEENRIPFEDIFDEIEKEGQEDDI